MVYLIDSDNLERERIDSCLVSDNIFSFIEQIDSNGIRFIEFNKSYPTLFIKEPGDINIEIGDKGVVLSGANQNTLYQEFKNEITKISINFRNNLTYLEDLDKKGELSLDEFGRIDKEKDAIQTQFENCIINFINIQQNSELVQYVVCDYANEIHPTKLQLLLDVAFKGFENDKYYIFFKKMADAAVSTDVGTHICDIQGINLHGDSISLFLLLGKNKITMVDFWASWCGPCRASSPKLRGIYTKYKSEGLEIVGFTLDENINDWLNAVKEDGIEWNQIATLNEDQIHSQYGIMNIPSFMLVDENGIIKYKGSGSNTSILEMQIISLLEE